jgi:tetratricopeptide (TPR) repeat protein
MRWTGHYPRVVDRRLPAADEPAPPDADAEFFAERAAARLETARVDGAAADLETALRLAPGQPMALALQAIMASARADHDAAIRLATAATTARNASAEAWLALSYAQQSVADLDGSSTSAMRAAALEPDNALALSRMASLALANGDVGASIEYATQGASLAPGRADHGAGVCIPVAARFGGGPQRIRTRGRARAGRAFAAAGSRAGLDSGW